jgi:hypothetical protein
MADSEAVRIAVRQHNASADCWCEPTVDYKDPDTGVAVYVHRSIQ